MRVDIVSRAARPRIDCSHDRGGFALTPSSIRPRAATAGLVAVALLARLTASSPAAAQTPGPAAAPNPDTAHRVDLSGVLYAHYRYSGERGSLAANRFDVERAYVTVRTTLGDRASARVTADVF